MSVEIESLVKEKLQGDMVQVINGEFIYSPSDMTSWSKCQWGYVRKLDSKLEKGNVVPPETDPMMLYSARNGIRHENYVLRTLQGKYGHDNVVILSDDDLSPKLSRSEKLAIMADRTAQALKQKPPVVFQVSFFDGKYAGFADFLEYVEIDRVWAYEVLDTKLALSDRKHVYDLQLASYARHLERLGIPVHSRARLIHGDLSESEFYLPDIFDRLDLNLSRLNEVEAQRRSAPHAEAWLSDTYSVCGECASCKEQIDLDPGDLLRVAGLGPAKRNLLISKGILRIPELAQVDTSASLGIPAQTLTKLTQQAQRQWAAVETNNPQITLENAAALKALPEFTEGDLYFDFETDPIFYVEGSPRLGITYLFGLFAPEAVELSGLETSDDGQFHYLWADSREEEESIFRTFLEQLLGHHDRYPQAHVYHYSAFEITTLRQLTKHYSIFETELDYLISRGIFIDLKNTVTAAISHGLAGYSIKQLEPLYMGNELRTGTKNATASITRYDDYHRTLNGENLELGESAQEIKEDVLQYNRYDCYSMLRLKQWLTTLSFGT